MEFFIIIPIIAIVVGSIITKVFIVPRTIQTAKVPTDAVVPVNLNDSQKNSSIINGKYNLFVLQAGAFVSKKNADILQNGIKSKGMNAFVIKDLDVFRVIIDITEDKNLLMEKKDKLKPEGYECLINEIDFRNSLGNGTGEEAAIKGYVDSVMNMLAVEIRLKDGIGKMGTVDLDEFISSASSVNEKYKNVSNTNVNTKIMPAITAFNDKFVNGVENFKIGFEKKDTYMCQQNAAEQALIFNNFYKAIIQTFVK
jgi:hypothetical protein